MFWCLNNFFPPSRATYCYYSYSCIERINPVLYFIVDNDLITALIIKPSINFRVIIGFVISGFFLWLTFNNSGLTLDAFKVSSFQCSSFVEAIFILVVSLWIYSVRAKLIWTNQKCRRSYNTISSLMLGNFYNSILPGNLGEGIRAWHFSKKNNVSIHSSIAAIITEKWLDAQVFSVLVLLLFIIKPFKGNYISYALVCTALTVALLSITHLLMRRYANVEKKIWSFVLYLGKAGKFLFRLYAQTNVHLENMKRNNTRRSYVALFSLIFALNVLQFFLLQKAAGVTGPILGIYSSFFVSLTMMIIAFIPSAPGSIGVLHYGIYSALLFVASQYGFEPKTTDQQSFALFAVFVHLSFFFPEVFFGILFLFKEKNILFGGNFQKNN